MPKIKYKDIKFRGETLALVDKCNDIIATYTAQGFVLTLRQLYYQLVSRAIIANKQTEYDRLGSIVNDARLAGLIDWHAIEDRTRNLRALQRWDNPSQIAEAAAAGYRMDMWVGQENRVEVWIERTPWWALLNRHATNMMFRSLAAVAIPASRKCGWPRSA